ncbi:metallophosphoesterase [Clostridium disporicum]|uniref:metallophosphoesterase n=1 Tax=Clostridium disporicum TaxID=84024 RepID=UPI0034A10C62
MSTYVTSDIHGCYDEFIEMLDLIDFKTSDNLYVLGDVVDRQDGGIDLLEFIRGSENITLLKGNHEQMMYDALTNNFTPIQFDYWLLKNGGFPTYKAFMELSHSERNVILNYVNELPEYKIIELNGVTYVLVHAGLRLIDGFDLNDLLKIQGDDLLWIRTSFLNSKVKTDFKIIFGHTVTATIPQYIKSRDDRTNQGLIWFDENKIGIDCGCSYGLRLSCLRLDDMKEFYINKKDLD